MRVLLPATDTHLLEHGRPIVQLVGLVVLVEELQADAHRGQHPIDRLVEQRVDGVVGDVPELEERLAAAEHDRITQGGVRGREDDELVGGNPVGERVVDLHYQLVAVLVDADQPGTEVRALAYGQVGAVSWRPSPPSREVINSAVCGELPWTRPRTTSRACAGGSAASTPQFDTRLEPLGQAGRRPPPADEQDREGDEHGGSEHGAHSGQHRRHRHADTTREPPRRWAAILGEGVADSTLRVTGDVTRQSA